jgi:hypothetical protein
MGRGNREQGRWKYKKLEGEIHIGRNKVRERNAAREYGVYSQ